MSPLYVFRMADGFSFKHRAIGFLEDCECGELDAGMIFDHLGGNPERYVRASMDCWIDGQTCDSRFHGWPNDHEHKPCFTFKWKEKRQHHRLYGFLCNPTPATNRSFRLCVLVFHSCKNDWATDPTILDRCCFLQQDFKATEAISQVYPEYLDHRGINKWRQ
jgi:hypothetical protein